MLIGDLCLCMTPARRHWTRWAPGRDWRWSPVCVRGLDLNHGQQLRCRGGGGGDHTHPRHSRATDKFRGHGDTWVGGRHWSLATPDGLSSFRLLSCIAASSGAFVHRFWQTWLIKLNSNNNWKRSFSNSMGFLENKTSESSIYFMAHKDTLI